MKKWKKFKNKNLEKGINNFSTEGVIKNAIEISKNISEIVNYRDFNNESKQ